MGPPIIYAVLPRIRPEQKAFMGVDVYGAFLSLNPLAKDKNVNDDLV
jgi:hypothetical protein